MEKRDNLEDPIRQPFQFHFGSWNQQSSHSTKSENCL